MSYPKLTPIIAKGTTEPRYLEDRFIDIVNVKDYGAKGDGTTNDTVAFQTAGATGKNVFVPAGEYAITSNVAGRFISFGGVRLSSNYVNIVDLSVLAAHNPIDIVGGTNDAKVILRSDRRGTGSYSRATVQSVAYDPVDNYIYMLHQKDYISNTSSALARYGSISRHRPSYQVDVSTADISADLTAVGHQGLSVEHVPGDGLRLWSSAQYGDDPCSVVRFRYNAGADVSDFERYVLTRSTETASSSLTPCISYDQRLLLVGYVKAGSGSLFVRIFKLQDLLDGGPGSYDGKQLVEFPVTPLKESGTVGFQGMVCDGAYVYVLASDTTADTDTSAAIYCYSVQGEFIAKNTQVDLGFAESIANGSSYCEAESLLLMPVDGRLSLVVAVNIGVPIRDDEDVIIGTANKLYLYALNSTGFKSNSEFPKPVALTGSSNLNTFTETGFFTKAVSTNVSNWPDIGANGFFYSIGNPSTTTFQLVGRLGTIDTNNYMLAYRINYNNTANDWWYLPTFLARCYVSSNGTFTGRSINIDSLTVVDETHYTITLIKEVAVSSVVIVTPTISTSAVYGSGSVSLDGKTISVTLSAQASFSMAIF